MAFCTFPAELLGDGRWIIEISGQRGGAHLGQGSGPRIVTLDDAFDAIRGAVEKFSGSPPASAKPAVVFERPPEPELSPPIPGAATPRLPRGTRRTDQVGG